MFLVTPKYISAAGAMFESMSIYGSTQTVHIMSTHNPCIQTNTDQNREIRSAFSKYVTAVNLKDFSDSMWIEASKEFEP